MKYSGVINMIRRKVPKVVQINDIIEWNEKDELEISPNYQRNSVWNEKAKSYLMDTIIRGLPIPPIFMRQTIDVTSRKTLRQVIDGQQRVRAITEFIDNKYKISKSHNAEYGGMYYEDLDTDVKEAILEYELFVEIVNEKDDSIIYDMFARLNTNNCVLNNQEIRNAKFWGEFKVAVYSTSTEYRELILENHILSEKQISRMTDVELMSMLFNLMLNGIEQDTQKSIDALYKKYDMEFPEFEWMQPKLEKTMNVIKDIYDYLGKEVKCFKSKTYLFTLFAVVYHQLYGIKGFDGKRKEEFSSEQMESNFRLFLDRIINFENDFNYYLNSDNIKDDSNYIRFNRFEILHRTRTTSKVERKERINFLNTYIVGDNIGE